MSESQPEKRGNKKIQSFYRIFTELVNELVLIHYYLTWSVFFGSGLLIRIKLFPEVMVPGFIQYLQAVCLAAAFLLFFFSYIREHKDFGTNRYRNKILLLTILPAFIFFIIGFMIPATCEKSPDNIDHVKTSKNSIMTAVQGRVNSHPETSYGNLCFSLTAESCQQDVIKRGDKLEIKIKKPGSSNIQRDDYIKIKGELMLLGEDIALMTNGSNIEVLPEQGFSGSVYGFRQRVFNCIDGAFTYYLGYKDAPLARALILGDRTDISGRQYSIFRKSGTAHLIAISGMHISFLAAIIYTILKKILKKALVIIFILVILLFYNFLLGPGASIMRATIWVLVSAVAATWNREVKPAYILCISFIILPLFNPRFIEDAGFWLSFSAMAGIVFIYPVMMKMLKMSKLPENTASGYFTGAILATVSIQLMCGPLLLYYFGSLPLISPISNLVILPFFYLLILLLFTAAFICIIWPPAGGMALKITPIFFSAVNNITRFFSDSSFPSIEIEDMTGMSLFVYYISVEILLIIIRVLLRKRFDF